MYTKVLPGPDALHDIQQEGVVGGGEIGEIGPVLDQIDREAIEEGKHVMKIEVIIRIHQKVERAGCGVMLGDGTAGIVREDLLLDGGKGRGR